MESHEPNVFKIGRQSDESQGSTISESHQFNPCDSVRYCNSHQGSTTLESTGLDDGNGRMNVDFRDIFRGFFMIEAMISVDG